VATHAADRLVRGAIGFFNEFDPSALFYGILTIDSSKTLKPIMKTFTLRLLVDIDFKEKVAIAVIRYRRGTITRFISEAIEHYIAHLEATETIGDTKKNSLPTMDKAAA